MSETPRHQTLDANEAVANVAYRLSEVISIYPITPASVMGEYADAWSADRRTNLWGTVPEVVEMQSEGGAAGAVHGALQAGALTTTFTASQGLLLMLPDLFKIAGELTAFCMHVAARTVATHALSIFGDRSDVMATRGTGFALLASGSAQEAQDLASLPNLIGGRFGLASKEFTPAMVKAVFDELRCAKPKRRFTVGIRDDVSGASLSVDRAFDIEPDEVTRAIFFGLGADGTVSANKATIKIIGERTPGYAQGHFEYASRKAGSTTNSYLRFGPHPIRSTYRIARAHFVAVHDPEFLERRDVTKAAMPGATVLLNTPLPADRVWGSLPLPVQQQLLDKRCRLFVIDGYGVAERAGLGRLINTVMQACFFALAKVLPIDDAMRHLGQSIEETWGRRGPELVRRNLAALDSALAALREVAVPIAVSTARRRPPVVPLAAPDFVQRVARLLIEGNGDELPVSAFPPDGTWPSGTSRFEKRAIALEIPIWQPDVCVQCNRCVLICPHASIRAKVYAPEALDAAPSGFRSVPEGFTPELEGSSYTIQVAPEDCTGCGLCVEICPAKDRLQPRRKALVFEPLAQHRDVERSAFAFAFFEGIESTPLTHLALDTRTVAFRPSLFEFSGACAGCGETPYLNLLTQLFGDQLLIANATGCSSIYGGNLPTTPYTTDRLGRGPAWSNSLFEDNAEFGYGTRPAVDSHVGRARALLQTLAPQLPSMLVAGLLSTPGDDAWIASQRARPVASPLRSR